MEKKLGLLTLILSKFLFSHPPPPYLYSPPSLSYLDIDYIFGTGRHAIDGAAPCRRFLAALRPIPRRLPELTHGCDLLLMNTAIISR